MSILLKLLQKEKELNIPYQNEMSEEDLEKVIKVIKTISQAIQDENISHVEFHKILQKIKQCCKLKE